MKSPSLELLYQQIEKSILLVESYTEIEGLSFFIRTCRLKPYSYICEKKEKKTLLYKWWFDEFGNSLKIDNKKIKIIPNDLSLKKQCIASTDLYYGLNINKVHKISKMSYIIAGKDDDLYQDYFVLTFLGLDNYLRSYACLNQEWTQISPLLLGMPIVKIIADNLNLKYFLEFNNQKNALLPCLPTKQWLTCLPAHEHLLQELKKDYELICPIYNLQKEVT